MSPIINGHVRISFDRSPSEWFEHIYFYRTLKYATGSAAVKLSVYPDCLPRTLTMKYWLTIVYRLQNAVLGSRNRSRAKLTYVFREKTAGEKLSLPEHGYVTFGNVLYSRFYQASIEWQNLSADRREEKQFICPLKLFQFAILSLGSVSWE